MPTYQYACTACDHRFEAVQSFSEDSLTVCPECGGPLRKVFSSVGIVFKGSGFYRTDSRGSSGVAASTESGAKSESSDAPSTKVETASGGATPKHGELVKTQDPKSSQKKAEKSSTPAA